MKDTKEDKIRNQMFYLAFKLLQVSEAALVPGLSKAVGMQDSLQYVIIYCCYMFAIYYYLFAIRMMIIFTVRFSSKLHF